MGGLARDLPAGANELGDFEPSNERGVPAVAERVLLHAGEYLIRRNRLQRIGQCFVRDFGAGFPFPQHGFAETIVRKFSNLTGDGPRAMRIGKNGERKTGGARGVPSIGHVGSPSLWAGISSGLVPFFDSGSGTSSPGPTDNSRFTMSMAFSITA